MVSFRIFFKRKSFEIFFQNRIITLPDFGFDLMITNSITPFIDSFSNGLYGTVISFLLIVIFDTTGTLLAVTKRAGLMKDGKLKNTRQALLSDAISTTVGA
ncbi:hypothetical protein [Carnobacterium sp. TMP28]|uniref:hypothetical protein n=1 Tax=Carnobacterium sp. TMP28 TaxID=3397060 RepID=UPI0039E16D7D